MGVYKDKSTDTWYCKFYYKDWKGERHQTTKRGFRTKKDASLWEAEFKLSKTRSLHISFETFVEMYFEDKKNKLKERSIYSKRYMIARHILPYFENIKVDEVKPADIIQWQNAMKEKNYSETYLRMVQNQLTALYTHATRVYGLRDNPCSHVDKIGKSDAKHVDFWTKEEYERFIAVVDKDDKYYVLFELLFWCGIRIGEEYFETVYEHSRRSTKPVKWVYEVNPMFSGKESSLHTVSCGEDEAELYVPFNHMEYEETLNKARSKFCVYERRYGEEKYWSDPEYLFDWTDGEFV